MTSTMHHDGTPIMVPMEMVKIEKSSCIDQGMQKSKPTLFQRARRIYETHTTDWIAEEIVRVRPI